MLFISCHLLAFVLPNRNEKQFVGSWGMRTGIRRAREMELITGDHRFEHRVLSEQCLARGRLFGAYYPSTPAHHSSLITIIVLKTKTANPDKCCAHLWYFSTDIRLFNTIFLSKPFVPVPGARWARAELGRTGRQRDSRLENNFHNCRPSPFKWTASPVAHHCVVS